jgi:tRNA (guanine-N7-)-methyltransferase
MTGPAPDHRKHRLYGRSHSHALSARKVALVDTLLPALELPEGAFDPRALFPEKAEVWLEIGFGGGEHLAALAQAHPDIGFIGAEPYLDGMAKMLAEIEERGLTNVRLHRGDARDLVGNIADASLARIFIMFPDPWPKTRHWKRRIITDGFVAQCARILAPGGRLRFATDVASYQDWAIERFARETRLDWTARRADDWRTPPADHVTTRYEEKRLGDAKPVFYDFVRST